MAHKKIYGLIMTVLIITLIAFAFIKFWPKTNNLHYVEVGDSSDTDKDSSFYLDNSLNSLSERIDYGPTNYREVLNAKPFFFVFKKTGHLSLPTQALLEIEILGAAGDIYLDDKLIFPGIDNYEILKEFDNFYLYRRSNVKEVENYDSSNIVDFLIKNYYGSKVYSINEVNYTNPVSDEYSPTITLINSTFRDSIALTVYGEGTLNLSFIKKDLNNYNGEDKYTMSIVNINGTSIFNRLLEDDGVTSATKRDGNDQRFEFNIPNANGIYNIKIIRVKNGEDADSTIGDIKVNTNKVLISGNFLPITPISLYTKLNTAKNASFYYWHQDKDQIIGIRSTENKNQINLNESYKGKKYAYEFKEGSYNIDIPKGYLWILSNISFSPSRDNWFEVPIVIQDTLDDADFIILDKGKIRSSKKSIVIKHPLVITNETTTFAIRSTGKQKLKLDKVRLITK